MLWERPPASDDTVNLTDMSARSKRALRARARDGLRSVGVDERAQAASALVLSLEPWLLERAQHGPVGLFASMPDELETRLLDGALQARGMTRALPVCVGATLRFVALAPHQRIDDLPAGPLGIRTPPLPIRSDLDSHVCPPAMPPRALAALIVPGLAFDRSGGRLGRGKGYYDRALQEVDLERAVGVGLDIQLVDAVPLEPHDVVLRWLWTPSRGVFGTFCASV